jgi:hypothetical protein
MRQIFWSAIFLTTTMFGCGWISTGTARGTDAKPTSAEVIATGNLAGMNGASVSGSVIIYKSQSNNGLIIRLEGLSVAVAESSVYLNADLSSGQTFTSTLKFYYGNSNYNTTEFYPTTISRISLVSPTRAVPREIASASLTSP